MALLEIFDEQNQPLGTLKKKSDVHIDGDWHRTSEIVVINHHHQLLLSLRHPDKTYLPNYWDVCLGGHLDPGETYEEAAVRELEEEIGLKPSLDQLYYLGTMAVVVINEAESLRDYEHAGVFVWLTDVPIDAFSMQADEVAALRWMPIAEAMHDLTTDKPSLCYTPPNHTYCQTLTWVQNWIEQQR